MIGEMRDASPVELRIHPVIAERLDRQSRLVRVAAKAVSIRVRDVHGCDARPVVDRTVGCVVPALDEHSYLNSFRECLPCTNLEMYDGEQPKRSAISPCRVP